jgi:hypothetical protein
MGLNDLRLIVRPGGGLVARRAGAVLLIADGDEPAAIDLLTVAASSAGAFLVERLFDVVHARRPAPVSAFCVLVEEGGELQIAIHGNLVVDTQFSTGTRTFAGSTPTSRVEEILGGELQGVKVGPRTAGVAGEALLDLVAGVASGGAFDLVPRAGVVTAAVDASLAAAPAALTPAEIEAPGEEVEAMPPPDPPAAAIDPGATLIGVPPPEVEEARAELKQAMTMAFQTIGSAPEHGAAPEVSGRLCPSSHLNSPSATECWICGAAVGNATGRGPRPPLGRVSTKDKRSWILDGNFVLGRQPETAEAVKAGRARPIVIPNEQSGVSRAHAEIELDGWTIRVRDLASSNGTFVLLPGRAEWQRVDPAQPATITSGTVVTLGGYEFLVESL